MSDQSRLAISARLEEVRHACDFVVGAAESAGLDERAVYHCQMAVDETLTNIIEHGYDYQGDDHQIEIICKANDTKFLITIADRGPAFNPLEYDSPDPSAPLDDREPGGWGIYFIRRLMDDVTYTREAGRNHLTLTKNLPEQVATPVLNGDDAFPAQQLDNHAAVVRPSGRLDSNNSPRLETGLNGLLKTGHTWLFVDLTDVDYIASSGLKVLVAAWRRAREAGGDVVLCGLQPRLVEIFEMVGFDMLFDVYPNLGAALAARPTQ
jgi:serine/threonine-protein kinase RsbW